MKDEQLNGRIKEQHPRTCPGERKLVIMIDLKEYLSKNNEMKILDFTSFCAAEDVKNLLYQHWLGLCAQDITPSHYYCGITNDPDRRKEQHESELGKTINYLCVCKCASAKIAGRVEELMAKKGFDIGNVDFGGNGKADDSVYVYLFKK